ncbi:hypothetical protein CYMTET_49506 [Cymbomonas tetramitiformis]|uniref:Uncharacterized protein n=1 Tax=Cymbomonas tetramitiformis TaxID=36881 RepID=A0AAE0BQ18_9CHLO|nr:hypothetical protein CYMTET_49506 [Cymbomonas tetramitiformis]
MAVCVVKTGFQFRGSLPPFKRPVKKTLGKFCPPLRPARINVVSLANKGKGRKLTGNGQSRASASALGLGKKSEMVKVKGSAELPYTVRNIKRHEIYVRTAADAKWIRLGSIVVESTADAENALRERRSLLRNAASVVPEVVLGMKGKDPNTLQYGTAFSSVEQEADEGRTPVVPDLDRPAGIKHIDVGGSVLEKVPARISFGQSETGSAPIKAQGKNMRREQREQAARNRRNTTTSR